MMVAPNEIYRDGGGNGMKPGDTDDRLGWPAHRPGPAYEAPIPGLHWYGGCEPGYPRVNPATGICAGCGEHACPSCGRSNCPDFPGCGDGA